MISRTLLHGLAIASLMLTGAAALKVAEHQGLIGPDMTIRASQVFVGLVLAAYANFIPKRAPMALDPDASAARARSISRLAGWAFALAGLGYAALWAFVPTGLADPLSMVVVIAAILLIATYCLRARTRRNAQAAL